MMKAVPGYEQGTEGRGRGAGVGEGGSGPNGAALLDTPGCRVPYMEPLSPEVESFVYDYDSIACDDPPPLVDSNDTAVFVVRSAVAAYNASELGLACCYRAMWRHDPDITVPDWDPEEGSGGHKGPLYDGVKYGNDIRYSKDCTPFGTSGIEVPHEFIGVECSADDTKIYQDYHAFVPQKKPRGYEGSDSHNDEHSLNVIILGIDAVSRLNFLRKMTGTASFLNETLHAIDLLGYNKVEDNTFPNLVPLLTGFSVPELRRTCWNSARAHFDSCPWIWKMFNRNGYVNSFVEDTAWMGLFHYLKKGFIHQPTDYDPRPLLYVGERELGRGKGLNAHYCIGQRLQIEVLLDYAKKFIRSMQRHRRKYFGLFWGTSLSHDYLNQPDEADELFEEFLQDTLNSGTLNNTALIFMSDHGLRYGKILSTYQGHIEERMPPMYYVLPDWFKKRYPLAISNLISNRRRLSTVYDLHETLKNFMDLSTLEPTRLTNLSASIVNLYKARKPPRGISLFASIPDVRTCVDAGIPDHYCACQHLTQVSKEDSDVQKVAKFVLKRINSQLKAHKQCAVLHLNGVHDAWRGQPLTHVKPSKPKKFNENEYQITFNTEPGLALLSATVRHNLKSNKMRLVGTISRLNTYGNSSWCVKDTKLRLTCYCKKPPPASVVLSKR